MLFNKRPTRSQLPDQIIVENGLYKSIISVNINNLYHFVSVNRNIAIFMAIKCNPYGQE